MSRLSKTNLPLISFDYEQLKKNGVVRDDLKKYFPEYILNPKPIDHSIFSIIFLKIIQTVLIFFTWALLRPRGGKVGKLNKEEVDYVYTKEARVYNLKHHITTRGMDLVWRRACGWFLSTLTDKEKLNILDLCTGTGLTTQELGFILEEFNIKANIVAVDYNKEMLKIAEKINTEKFNNVSISFKRGDATNLVDKNFKNNDFIHFQLNFFDVVIQMFGLGGVDNPLKEFEEVLKVLQDKGFFFIVDMHKPIPHFPGEWPLFFVKWLRFPKFESFIYETTTMPLILNRLWGWRDTTILFYLISLVTYQEGNKYWGFKKTYFYQEAQRWWFSLPLMSIAKLKVQKIELTKEEAEKRMIILKSSNFIYK